MKCTLGDCIYIGTHDNFKKHIKCDHGDFPCFVCDLQTGSSGALKQHINDTHKDLTECPKCNHTAKTPLKLREHMRKRHTIQKLETESSGGQHKNKKKCPIPKCIYIATYDNITRHQKTKHGNYPCCICTIQTGSVGAVKQHVQQEHKDLTDCPQCNHKAITLKKLCEHMKKMHPIKKLKIKK